MIVDIEHMNKERITVAVSLKQLRQLRDIVILSALEEHDSFDDIKAKVDLAVSLGAVIAYALAHIPEPYKEDK
jgi:N-acetyl-beta-hexosaminidase